MPERPAAHGAAACAVGPLRDHSAGHPGRAEEQRGGEGGDGHRRHHPQTGGVIDDDVPVFTNNNLLESIDYKQTINKTNIRTLEFIFDREPYETNPVWSPLQSVHPFAFSLITSFCLRLGRLCLLIYLSYSLYLRLRVANVMEVAS